MDGLLRSCPHLKWYEDGMHVLLRSREAPGQECESQLCCLGATLHSREAPGQAVIADM